MRNGVVLSSVFHGLVLALLIFGLPSFVEPPTTTLVPIEIVTLDEKEPPKPEPKPEPKPQTTAEKVAPKPPEPPVEEAKPTPEPPKPVPEPIPEPPKPEAKPEPEPEPAPPEVKPEPEPEKVVLAPPKPRKRPEIKPEPPKKKDEPKPDQLASILRNVLKDNKPAPTQKAQPEAEKPGPTSRQVSVFEQNDMVREIQQQLFGCWRLDPGAASAEDLVVEVRVILNPDGSLQRADVVDVARMAQDSYFRSAAENARRAIYKCSPFRLPVNKYEVWRELTLRFNPREMFGT